MSTKHPVRRVFLVLTIIAVVALAFFGFTHYKDTFVSGTPNGILYLSLATKAPSETEPQGWTSSYAWSPENDSLSPFIKEDGHHYLDTVFSPDDEQIATVEVSSPFSTRTPTKIIVMDTDLGNRSEYAMSVDTPVRMPAWSPDGKTIAYMQLASNDLDITIPSNWRIYEIDLETGKETFVTNGLNPLFNPNGDLLVLKDDGLYQIQDGGSDRLWEVSEGTVQAHMRISLSKDGSKLAWVIPEYGEVMILKINSWEPFSAEMIALIPVTSYSAMFSPKGDRLALQRENEDDTDSQSNVAIYETERYTLVNDFNLKGFVPWETAITDWK